MLITPIINKLKTDVTSVTSVEYAYNINAALPENRPIIYVSPLSESADPSPYDNYIKQRISASIAITIGVDAQNDELQNVRDEIFSSLLGFIPATNYDAIEYDSGDLLDSTSGVLWWKDVYKVNYFIKQN